MIDLIFISSAWEWDQINSDGQVSVTLTWWKSSVQLGGLRGGGLPCGGCQQFESAYLQPLIQWAKYENFQHFHHNKLWLFGETIKYQCQPNYGNLSDAGTSPATIAFRQGD